MLTPEQGKLLLSLASEAIMKKSARIPDKPYLKEKRGVFVTITEDEELRGCIGIPYPVKELGRAVAESARNAAFNDSRFPPVRQSEMKNIRIEVSVLTLPESCKLEDIIKGDGVILEKNKRCALFLPQVWNELPSKEEFLKHLSMKASLPPDAYKTANYQKFQVQCFK